MKFSTNTLIQLLATAGQVTNLIGSAVPPKTQPYVAGVLALIQSVTGMLAHFSNPDGNPAQVAYVPKEK